jgi:hypothetical protein
MDNVQKALAAQRKRRADIQSAYDAKKKSATEARLKPTPVKSSVSPVGVSGSVSKAIEAQRKRRADIQSAYDSRKKSAIEARKGIVSPTKTTPTAPIKSTSKPDGYSDYMNTVRGESFKTSAPKKPVSSPKGPSIAQKRAAFSAANSPTVGELKYPSTAPTIEYLMKNKIGVAGLSKAAPKSIAPARTYTDKEKQISSLLATGKKKDGTMKASAQRKIQRIRKK